MQKILSRYKQNPFEQSVAPSNTDPITLTEQCYFSFSDLHPNLDCFLWCFSLNNNNNNNNTKKDRKLSLPPRCHQCSPVSPAAQQRCCISGTQLLPLAQGPKAAQVVTERAGLEAERGHWVGPLPETAPVGAEIDQK